MQILSTENELEQWSKWCNYDRLHELDFQSVSAIVPPQLRVAQNRKKLLVTISDDDAMEIDGVLATLLMRYPETGVALILYFFCNCNNLLTSKVLKIDPRKCNVLVKSGVAWVDATLNMLRA